MATSYMFEDIILSDSGKLNHSLIVEKLVLDYFQKVKKQFKFSYTEEDIIASARFHDIGYGLVELHENHQMAGWMYFKDVNLLLAKACLFHSQGPEMLISKYGNEYKWILDITLTLEEYIIISLISKADRLSGPDGQLMRHEERLSDIYSRHSSNLEVMDFEKRNLVNFSILADLII